MYYNIEIKFDKKKTFNRKSIKYLQNFIFQESVKLPSASGIEVLPKTVFRNHESVSCRF